MNLNYDENNRAFSLSAVVDNDYASSLPVGVYCDYSSPCIIRP